MNVSKFPFIRSHLINLLGRVLLPTTSKNGIASASRTLLAVFGGPPGRVTRHRPASQMVLVGFVRPLLVPDADLSRDGVGLAV